MSKPLEKPMYEYIYETLEGVVENRAAIEYKSKELLPDDYVVYYLVSGMPEGFFSGSHRRENARYSICIHDRDKRGLEGKEPAIVAAMQNAGFMYVSKSRDTYIKDTGHWQRTLDFRYYEEV